jgi:hypothetical protein
MVIVIAVFYAMLYVPSCYTQKAKISVKARLNTEVAGELVSMCIS